MNQRSHSFDRHSATGVPRRRVLLAAPIGALTLGAVGVAACSTDEGTDSPAATGTEGTNASGPGSPGGVRLAATADVPVGGATVVGDVIITQATEGDFAAFSTKCPHKGCDVGAESDKLHCPCHGSEFSFDGAVTHGPAKRGLDPIAVTVKGADIVRS
ncbi:ubiquinol-cytochrome c reductase iron-sulfur subunit [Gordonia zhaorongruii]|uniref:QcrA and Rieske domain-containing protein n=1 Tax=Gordonia zhaorongruii TaxID=2597659 RepID=UPI00105321E8|nr:Rieske (2Fe-2S) protein [Gordonia zhaorongruii]